MPAPGDQHNGIANPFEESKPRISEFTAREIATLQSRLEKQLGPEYISARSGPSGAKVHYITAEKCIALANEVFGFNGWSSSIQNIQVDFVDENPQTLKISLGLSVIVRVTLRDGTYHEDIGYGHIENCKGKAAAFEKSKKEGTTDALKRALRNFGNVLGNCIYDKDYLSKVTKIKVGPTKFDEQNLHRHAEFAKKEQTVAPKPPVKTEPGQGGTLQGPPQGASDSLDDDFGDFDMADFGVMDDGHPDEVALPASHGVNSNDTAQAPSAPPKSMAPPSKSLGPNVPIGQYAKHPQTPNQPQSRPGGSFLGRPNPPPPQSNKPPHDLKTSSGPTMAQQAATSNTTTVPAPNGNPPESVGFFSARSVTAPPEGCHTGDATIPPSSARVFNPHAESPSIRKTPGIDHKSSRPVARDGKHVSPLKRKPEQQRPDSPGFGAPGGSRPGGQGPSSGPMRPGAGAVGNPALHHARQIGAPGAGGSPLANRGQYKPPTIKRPGMGSIGGDSAARPALADVSANEPANGSGATGGIATDTKRQKMA